MNRLGKIFRPPFLTRFLEQALSSLPQGSTLSLLDGESNLVLALGPDRTPRSDGLIDAGDCLSFGLELDGELVGHLLAGPRSLLEADERATGAAGFIALSLSEMLERENLRRQLGEETLEQFRELALTRQAIVNLNRSMKVSDVVEALVEESARRETQADCVAVFLWDTITGRYSLARHIGPLNAELLTPMAHSRLLMDALSLDAEGEIINHLEREPRWRNECPGLASIMVAPLRSSGSVLGALVLGGLRRGDQPQGDTFSSADLKKTTTLGSVAGIALSNAIHFEQTQHILTTLMESMSTAIDARDRCTAGHSQRVAHYALGLAHAVNRDREHFSDVFFDSQGLEEIYYAGLLHDVGKIGVREEVLTKSSRLPRAHLEVIGLRLALWGENNGGAWRDILHQLEQINKAYDMSPRDEDLINQLCLEQVSRDSELTIISNEERRRLFTPRGNLTTEEWREIKRHPRESYRILKNIPFGYYFPNILNIILQHHERLDGSGYPMGLKGSSLSMQSRILAIVDIYDSLRRDRHYKKALPQSDALEILHEEARLGKLDARLVQLFTRNLATIEHFVLSDMAQTTGAEQLQ